MIFDDSTNGNLTIRHSTHADAPALLRLAQLDSAAPLDSARVLVAEIDGRLVAALPLGGGGAIADPFRHTAGVLQLLRARAAELGASGFAPRRRPVPRLLRLSPPARA